MKKVSFLVIAMVAMISFVLISCDEPSQKSKTVVTTEKVTYSEGGFYVEQQMVVNGNTVWGISQKVYGTGLRWHEIVSLNPFLNNPSRLYYNSELKKWIVRIYPGEVLNIRGDIIYPSCVYEQTTTTELVPTQEPIVSRLMWLVITLFIIGVIVFFLLRRNNGLDDPYSSIVHVDMSDRDINFASQKALEEREEYLKAEALKVADKVNISSLDIILENNKFALKASYFDAKEKKDKE